MTRRCERCRTSLSTRDGQAEQAPPPTSAPGLSRRSLTRTSRLSLSACDDSTRDEVFSLFLLLAPLMSASRPLASAKARGDEYTLSDMSSYSTDGTVCSQSRRKLTDASSAPGRLVHRHTTCTRRPGRCLVRARICTSLARPAVGVCVSTLYSVPLCLVVKTDALVGRSRCNVGLFWAFHSEGQLSCQKQQRATVTTDPCAATANPQSISATRPR